MFIKTQFLSFELYNGFRQDIPVRKVMPGYQKSDLENEGNYRY